MKIVSERDDFICGLLGPEDLRLFAKARLKCWRDKPDDPDNFEDIHNAHEIVEAATREGPEYWRGVFEHPDTRAFVLFEITPEGKTEIAGIVDLDCGLANDPPTHPEIQNLHVVRSRRGQGLSGMLYHACIDYVLENLKNDYVMLLIDKGNAPNIRAAEKNGFTLQEEYIGKLVYGQPIGHRRTVRPTLAIVHTPA